MSRLGIRKPVGAALLGALLAGVAAAALWSIGKPAASQPSGSMPDRVTTGFVAGFQPGRFVLVNARTVELRGWLRNETVSAQAGDCNVVMQVGGSGSIQSGVNFTSSRLGPGQTAHFAETFTGDAARWVASHARGRGYPKTLPIDKAATVSCGIAGSPASHGSWAQAHPGVAEPPFTYLQQVSCSSPDACLAIGERQQAGHSAWLAERWDGRLWRLAYSTTRARPMEVVACPTPTWCLIVGRSVDVGATSGDWMAVWRPSGTTILRTRGLGRSSVTSMSCFAPNVCIVAGLEMLPRSSRLLLATFDGTTFVPMYTHLNSDAQATAMSCSSPSNCMLVGPLTSRARVFAARWNGRFWTATSTPKLTIPTCFDVCRGVPTIDGISCGTIGCLALGSPKLAEWWNGTSWAKVPIPGKRTWLVRSSCAQSGCLAVGYRAGTHESPVAYWWDGASWHDASPQFESKWALGATFTGVWCGTGAKCVGIGSVVAYPIAGPDSFELSGIWRAGHWRTLITRAPER